MTVVGARVRLRGAARGVSVTFDELLPGGCVTRKRPGINITDRPTRYELTLERAAEVDRALGEALRLLRAGECL